MLQISNQFADVGIQFIHRPIRFHADIRLGHPHAPAQAGHSPVARTGIYSTFLHPSVYLKIHNIILPLLGTVIKHKTVVVEIESHDGFRQAFHVVPRPQSRF